MWARLIRVFRDKKGGYVQFVLAVPVVFGLIFGGIIGYNAFNAKQVVTNAAREAARVAASSHSESEAKQQATRIVKAHLPTDTITSFGETSGAPSGYITGQLSKQGNYYYLSSLGLQPLEPADGTLKNVLDSYVGKTIAIKVDQVSKTPEIDHSESVEGEKRGGSDSGSGSGGMIKGEIVNAN